MAKRPLLNQLGAVDAAAKIAAGKLTSEALVRACLERIEEREGDVKAWAFVDPDKALAQARARDKESPRGPLHGVPVGIKDNIDTEDMPTEYGSKLYAGHQPVADAATVARLRAQGAVILGKTRTTEFACPFPTVTRNPHDLTRTPGVSSSGSAASVADFMVPLANGTQTGGSVIRPASLCGLYGFKGSLNALDRAGIRHLKSSIDTLGLFARSLADLVLMRAALTEGAKPAVPRPRKAPRIGLARTHVWPQAKPEMVQAIEMAQSALGAPDVTLPTAIEDSIPSFGVVTRYEGLLMTEQVVRDNIDQVNPWSRDGYLGGLKLTRADFDHAVGESQRARAALATVFKQYDVLITPAATGEAPADLNIIEGGSFNSLWTHMYVPCLTIPAFVGPNGMPVGLQIVGPHGADEAVLAAGAWIEAQLKSTNALPIRVG
jgi:Asp-tRNA(Asn)/Glu-tRNA(Gln) amidotransferase A subunit family amidase